MDLIVNLFIIKLIHRILYTGQAEAFDDFYRPFHLIRHLLEFFRRKLAKYIVDLSSTREITADTETKAAVFLCA
jgi:hypothetical protein